MAILGGVHRWASAQTANHTTIAAYTVTADDATLLRIRVEDNARHGMPTTAAERVEHAVALIATGMTQKDAAAIVGIPQPKLSIAVAANDTTVRAAALGVDDRLARLPQPTRYQLSMLDDDDVFTAAADFAARYRVPSTIIGSIVREIRNVEPHEALRLIGSEAAEWLEREDGKIRQRGRSARAEFEGALAIIAAADPAAVSAACPNDDVRAVLAQRIMKAAAVLAPAHELLTGGTKQGRAA
jgi:ParB-like chromosome segregation protein Spo0J